MIKIISVLEPSVLHIDDRFLTTKNDGWHICPVDTQQTLDLWGPLVESVFCLSHIYIPVLPAQKRSLTLLAIRKPEASNTVIFSASLSSAPPSLISPMLVTVIEFHTKRICDADTRWFCACKMMCCVSLAFALSFSRSLSSLYLKALAMLPKLVSKHYS